MAIVSRADIDAVLDLAREAGREILRLRPQVVAESKADGSPVTIADKTASDIIIRGLARITPHIPVVSEEAPEADNKAVQAAHDTYWITDPLDGTRSYLDGHDGFGVHIGLISKGEAVAGVIYFPAAGTAYFTDGVNGAFRRQDGEAAEKISIRAAAPDDRRADVVISWGMMKAVKGKSLPFNVAPAVGGARLCVVAQGDADVAVTEIPFSYWDIAAAHAVLKAAGGDYFTLAGGNRVTYAPDRLGIPPAIAGDAAVVESLRGKINATLAEQRAVARKPRP